MIRILVVDDQNLVKQGIKSLLEQDLRFKVIGTFSDGRHAIDNIAQINPDIVLLDIEMPGINGIAATKQINRILPKTKVIILSSHEERKYVMQALMAGAKGYLLKNSLMSDLKQAILAVYNGYSQVDSKLLAKVFDPKNIKAQKERLAAQNSQQKQSTEAANTIIQPVSPTKATTETETTKSKILVTETPTKLQAETADTDVAATEATEAIETTESTEVKEEETTPDRAEFLAKKKSLLKTYSVEKDEYSAELAEQALEIEPQSELNTAISQSALEPYRFPVIVNRASSKTSIISQYIAKITNHPKIAPYKPQIERVREKIVGSTNKFNSWFQKRSGRNLWWNVGLVFFGIAIAILFSR